MEELHAHEALRRATEAGGDSNLSNCITVCHRKQCVATQCSKDEGDTSTLNCTPWYFSRSLWQLKVWYTSLLIPAPPPSCIHILHFSKAKENVQCSKGEDDVTYPPLSVLIGSFCPPLTIKGWSQAFDNKMMISVPCPPLSLPAHHTPTPQFGSKLSTPMYTIVWSIECCRCWC